MALGDSEQFAVELAANTEALRELLEVDRQRLSVQEEFVAYQKRANIRGQLLLLAIVVLLLVVALR
jgi:hypothetical protein